MNYCNISLVKHLPDEARKKMEQGLKEYEISHKIDVDYSPFSLILRNEKSETIGVLEAFSSYSSIYINDMWVDKEYRGKGYGKQLLTEVERRFKGKGLHYINLVTCAFQAPEFYKKCGYTVEFVRENVRNPKLTTTFFIKHFDE